MKKWLVEVWEHRQISFEVDAECEEEAKNTAYDTYMNSDRLKDIMVHDDESIAYDEVKILHCLGDSGDTPTTYEDVRAAEKGKLLQTKGTEMNLYGYLMIKSNNTTRAAKEAKEAYERYREYGRTLVPVRDCDPFVFAFVDHGYQAFTFYPDQIVDAKGELAVVTGWGETSSGWKVRAKTAKGEFHWNAENLKPAEFPEGLVEILRGRVHGKVDEAFKEDKHD